jgi:hypothetical protein
MFSEQHDELWTAHCAEKRTSMALPNPRLGQCIPYTVFVDSLLKISLSLVAGDAKLHGQSKPSLSRMPALLFDQMGFLVGRTLLP